MKETEQEHRAVRGDISRRGTNQLRKSRKLPKLPADFLTIATDPQQLLHALEVHQVELQMQNAELLQARAELEAGLQKYTNLYDFAPVGYFTLTEKGTIVLANLGGAALVGIERARLVGRSFGLLMPTEPRGAFDLFLKQVFTGQAKQCGDFKLMSKGEAPRTVSIEAQRLPNGLECRLAVVDITARAHAEEQLLVSEIRYRRLFEAAQDGVLVLDPNTSKITDANPFMTKLLGYTHEQLVGKELFEIGLLKDQAASREMFLKLKRKHELRYEDLPLETQGGRHQEVEVVANLYEENGRSVIQCNIRDITARKRAEMVSIRLAAIVKSSDDAIISKDPNGIITSWNEGAEKLFLYTAREMVGSSIMRLIPEDRQDEEKQILGKILSGESVRHFETQGRAKDGRLIHISVTASPIQDANGNFVGVSKVARDITERKEMEAMLRRNEALFSTLVTKAPVGVYVVDAMLRLQQVNRRALHVFSRVHPLIGRDFSEILHILWPKRVADEVEKRFRFTLKTGEPYETPDFAERRRDSGVKEIYEWQIQRVLLPAGEHGVVCFFTDITERKRAEVAQRRLEVLAASNRKLEQEISSRQRAQRKLKQSEQHQRLLLQESRRMQGQLRGLAHQILHAQEEERKRISRELHDEIAQTLVGIDIHLGDLKREAQDNPARLEQKITRTQGLVRATLGTVHRFARELRPTILDDVGLIAALHAFIKEFQQRTGIQVRFTTINSRRIQKSNSDVCAVLYRVTQEALTNVARHAQASLVAVDLETPPGVIRLKIKDNGKSFVARRVMQSKRYPRLGLLGMRERLEMVGGSFSIESAPGQGTTVRAQIPFANCLTRGKARHPRKRTTSPLEHPVWGHGEAPV